MLLSGNGLDGIFSVTAEQPDVPIDRVCSARRFDLPLGSVLTYEPARHGSVEFCDRIRATGAAMPSPGSIR